MLSSENVKPRQLAPLNKRRTGFPPLALRPCRLRGSALPLLGDEPSSPAVAFTPPVPTMVLQLAGANSAYEASYECNDQQPCEQPGHCIFTGTVDDGTSAARHGFPRSPLRTDPRCFPLSPTQSRRNIAQSNFCGSIPSAASTTLCHKRYNKAMSDVRTCGYQLSEPVSIPDLSPIFPARRNREFFPKNRLFRFQAPVMKRDSSAR